MEQIGRYQLLGEAGRGAMGIVYRALDPSIGRTVAIKTIRLGDVVDEEERRRLTEPLFREATSAGRLSHPNIVTIYDIAQQGELAYVAMEFVDGPSLDTRIRTGEPLDGPEVVRILRQAAEALDYAHKNGIVHRDIKPANLLLHGGGAVKVTDFGVAKIQSHQMTLSGTLIGTPNYMSPEQIQGQPVSGRTDQFSLAVIAYELLTGEKPFVAESMPTLVFTIVKEEPAPAHRLNPTIDWPVDKVLSRALAKDPAARFETCSDFVRALENALKVSKTWKPIPPGGAAALPTVRESLADVQTAAGLGAAAQTPGVSDAVEPSRALRLARAAAVVIFVAGLVSVGGIYFDEYWSGQQAAGAPAREAPAPAELQRSPRPSAVGEPVEPPERAPAPGESAATSVPDDRETTALRPARIVTSPPGAAVFVDGQTSPSCTTPCELNLPRGRHTFMARQSGYRDEHRILQFPTESDAFIAMQKTTGTLMVRSDPSGASLIVDGQQRQEKTPVMMTVPTGVHRVEVRKEGYGPVAENVEVRDSTLTNVDVKLPGNQ